VHLPQLEFTDEGLSLRRLADAVDAARANGFAADRAEADRILTARLRRC
jgi:hypothetical protein